MTNACLDTMFSPGARQVIRGASYAGGDIAISLPREGPQDDRRERKAARLLAISLPP
jgi:hypothetical protein